MTYITPEEALDLISVARDSEGAFTQPWLDTKFDLLHTLVLNAYADPNGYERKTFNSESVQEQLHQIATKECYRTLARFPRFTASGNPSRRWFRTTRYKRYGKTPYDKLRK